MTEKTKPSMRVPIYSIVAAVFSLFAALIMLANRGARVWVKTVLLLGSMLVVVCAIIQWVVYFQKWVRFEIESHEERTKTKL